MKIYTRTGDDGTTGLLGPGRVAKHDPRVEAYGTVDELNAVLGTVRALDAGGMFANELESFQTALFSVGASLATTEAQARMPCVSGSDIVALEAWIDGFESDLPALRNFIQPAGTPLAAQLHLARTVCRRAERRVVALAQRETIEPEIVRYLNRLADLLFVMARLANRRGGVADVEWHPNTG